MRVAIFTEGYLPYVSGVVSHIETLKGELVAEGHEVLIVAARAGIKQQYVKDGVLYCPGLPLKKIYGYGLASPVSGQRMEYITAFAPDILHVHTEFSIGWFGRLAAQRLGKPLIYTLHTYYDDYLPYVVSQSLVKEAEPVLHAYMRLFTRRVRHIIAPSPKVTHFLAECRVHTPCTVLPNTVDTTRFRAENVGPEEIARRRAELGISEDDVCLCFVGRLGGEKSIDVLLQDFTEGFRGQLRFKLFLLGDGPKAQELKQYIVQQGMQDQIFCLGKIEHALLPAYYQCFSLYTTASLSEVYSISLLEAQAAGLYAVDRLDELNAGQIEPGVNGAYYTTVAEFAEAVRNYAQLPQSERIPLRHAIAQKAAQYGPRQYCQRLLAIYQAALDDGETLESKGDMQ